MDCSTFEHTKNVKVNSPKNHILDEIQKEYCLKQNIFNPKGGPSPNFFIKKLVIRMRVYYKDLYNA